MRVRALSSIWKTTFSARRHDLVMGCAAGYKPDIVKPFVESLFSLGEFIGTAVMFANPSDDDLITYLEKHGVRVVTFKPSEYSVPNPHMARYFAYAAYLRSKLNDRKHFRYVLLSDVRDVTFQKPLFSTLGNALEVHYETPLTRIGEEQWNSDWIRREFGEQVLKSLEGRRVSCSGTVNGRPEEILNYLEKMQSAIMGLPAHIKNGERGDQAVHNYILHSGLLPEASPIENFVRVATLHFVDRESVCADSDARVINPDGSISEIAHQWDRHPSLMKAINTKYGVNS
ncbi:MAG: hypothetical protein WDN02_06990 [Methylovirgula sp.]|uniref:hypothetical protein n=1 Tax=Methylovirgula sp. TaxID=1978224 RepID=UPI003076779B